MSKAPSIMKMILAICRTSNHLTWNPGGANDCMLSLQVLNTRAK